MPFLNEPFRERWFDFPAILLAAPVPLLVLALAWRFKRALDRREDLAPFLCALGLFLLSYAGLGISFWPLMVPPSITIWEAAAPPSSQAFLLVGAAVLIPLILAYTAYVYWLFRGKVTAESGYH
jgi:cytochrome d ubiquinol oxidase subunit II